MYFLKFQELTEEGLPFLILFHHPDDHESVELYTREVAKQIMSEKGYILSNIGCTTVCKTMYKTPS